MIELEQVLVDKGYWYWSKGDRRHSPTMQTTLKWNMMMAALFEAYPECLITEEMIWNYISDLS